MKIRFLIVTQAGHIKTAYQDIQEHDDEEITIKEIREVRRKLAAEYAARSVKHKIVS